MVRRRKLLRFTIFFLILAYFPIYSIINSGNEHDKSSSIYNLPTPSPTEVKKPTPTEDPCKENVDLIIQQYLSASPENREIISGVLLEAAQKCADEWLYATIEFDLYYGDLQALEAKIDD